MRSIGFESDVAGFGGAGEEGCWVGIGFATYGYGDGVGRVTDMGVWYWGLTLLKLMGGIGIMGSLRFEFDVAGFSGVGVGTEIGAGEKG